ncbi:MAG: tandem-95 repeat protein [Oscillospiraceae bacterium]|nr:tandem-95 repeat protein [Oscillospiraceae bacterium]
MLSGRSVQGGGEKFAVSSILGEGNIYLSEDGKFTYSAPLATRGVQTFEFTVTGSDGAVSLPASLKINVTKSKPPAAYTSTFEVRTNAELLSAVTVTDFDGMINNVEVVDKPTFGELIMSSDGQFKYVPETGFAGTDYFTYVAVDNDGDKSSLATATILVGQTRYCAAFNATHLAARDEVITAGFDYRATALPANNQEATPAEIADVVITQMSLYGTFEADNGGYSYTPYEDFAGTDTIKFKLKFSDKTESEEAIISIITIPSQKPSVFDYSLECIKNRTLSEKLTADDMDGTVAKYEITALPSNGTIELDTTTGEFVYEPSRGYTGADSFSFAVYDNEGLRSNEASVSVEVKTLTQSLRDSGKYFAAVVFVVLGVLAVIVFLALLAVHIVRKRKDEEREYRRQMKKKLH